MRRLIALSITFAFTVSMLISCGDSSTGPDPNGGETTTYNVTTSASPSDAGSVSPSADGPYEESESIELQADPNEQYLFTHWSGDIDSTADNPLSLTVDQDYALTANFEKKTYSLTTNIEGEGEVAEEIVQQQSKDYEHGTVVKLTADPADGYRFVEWTGDLTSTESPSEITVDEPKEVTAVFEKKSYSLTINTEGEGGVTEDVIQQQSKDYEHGTVVELTANPAEGYKFVEWTGDLSGTENPAQITVDNPKEVTAVFEKKSYALTTNTEGEGGITEEVVPQQSKDYEHNTVVELTANPADGWKFIEWRGALSGTENPKQVTVNEAKDVTAVFEKKSFALTINTNGSGSVTKTPEQETYEYGTTVELEATPDDGQGFAEWTGDVTGSENPTQITVNEAKEVTAAFEKKSYALTTNIEGEGEITEEVVPQKSKDYEHDTVVELTANPADGWKFIEWKGALSGTENPKQITVNEAKDVTAVFEKKTFALTINTNGSGSVTKTPDQETYKYGTTVELEATPDDGQGFAEWTGDVTGSENPTQITVNEAKEVTAVFDETFKLTIETSGEGTVSKSPDQSSYAGGTVVELTPNPAEGYKFVEWTGDLSGTDSPTQITVDDTKEVTAVFEKKSFALTVNTTGNGSITKSPDQETYEYDTTVELEATPASGHQFVEWTGAITSTDNPVQVTVDEETQITAVFEESLFYLASNGVTIKCPEAEYDDTGTVDGVTYTKRSTFSISPSNAPTTCTSGITDMKYLFLGESELTGNISHWDVSSVTNMNQMFEGAYNFNGDLSHWDVSSVTDMSEMFKSASSFNGDINDWDVSNVENMSQMFKDNINFNRDLNNWDVSSVTNMEQMFSGTENFNGNINGWDVSKVTSMVSMFEDAESFNQDLNNWTLSAKTNMESMFEGAIVFNGDINSWNVSNVENMSRMFYEASSFNGDLNSWDVSSVTDMDQMFRRASAFNGDISNWDIINLTDLNRMFAEAESFNQSLNGWDVSGITRMYGTFQDASSFNGNISNWNVSNVEDMENMFNGASSFNNDITGWDVNSVTNMAKMFKDAVDFNQAISGWSTGNVTEMWSMFKNAETFDQDLDDWNVTSVTDMHDMFQGATSFNQDISSWKTNNVTDMRSMFEDAFSFNQPIGGWDVSSAAISSMFYNASTFNQNLSGWCVESYSSEPTNFSTNSALTEGNMPEWGESCPGS